MFQKDLNIMSNILCKLQYINNLVYLKFNQFSSFSP